MPCHNDLLPGNFIHDGERLRIVDWEYAGMGSRYFDLGNLSVNNGLNEAGDEWLLECYWGEPCTRRRLATVRLMRIMSDFREAMWGVVQTAISEIDFDFEGYAEEHFERVRAGFADPRFAVWLEDAGVARDLPGAARCVIVGGGVGGCSIAYHLAQLGWEDVVLVDRNQLTSGSTFHSAGLVGQLRGSVSLTRMMMDSVELYRSLDCGWVECGGLRLASSRGALGGDAPPGRLGEDVRAAARAAVGRGGAASASR